MDKLIVGKERKGDEANTKEKKVQQSVQKSKTLAVRGTISNSDEVESPAAETNKKNTKANKYTKKQRTINLATR
jgi:hypothetical protein